MTERVVPRTTPRPRQIDGFGTAKDLVWEPREAGTLPISPDNPFARQDEDDEE